MGNPIGVTVNSITTKNEQKLYLGEDDVNLLNGKRVLLVDDVISTGESLHALETLVEKTGANIVGRASVLAEGDAKDRNDIIFLSELPIKKKKKIIFRIDFYETAVWTYRIYFPVCPFSRFLFGF